MQSSDVSDAMDKIGKKGALGGFFPVTEGTSAEGEALPVLVRKRDNPASMKAGLLEAVGQGSDGSVLVISSDSEEFSVWGGQTSLSAAKSHLRGVVVDGCARDLVEIRKSGLPVFAKRRTPVSGQGRLEVVSIGEPVEIDGVVVRKGDWVVADSDGVAVVPRADADAVRLRVAEITGSGSPGKRRPGRAGSG